MSRTSLVLMGLLLIIGALLLCGCGSDASTGNDSSARESVVDDNPAAGALVAQDDTEQVDGASDPTSGDTVDEALDEAVPSPQDGVVGQSASGSSSGTDPAGEGERSLTEAGTDTDAFTSATSPHALYGAAADEPEPTGQFEARTSPDGLSVTRAYICRGIEESEPTDAGRSFLPKEDGINRLCCFSEIAGAAEPDSIWHIWYWGDREMGRVGLAVKSARWRTWSRKQVLDEWKGEWRVDIVDNDGFLLYQLGFSIE